MTPGKREDPTAKGLFATDKKPVMVLHAKGRSCKNMLENPSTAGASNELPTGVCCRKDRVNTFSKFLSMRASLNKLYWGSGIRLEDVKQLDWAPKAGRA